MLTPLVGCCPSSAPSSTTIAAAASRTPATTEPTQFIWKLATTWPPSFPIFHQQLLKFADNINQMSQGRLKIEVYGGGILIPHAQTFDAVSQGTIQMAHSVAFYWVDKIPAAQFMSAIPFGMMSNGVNAWLYEGGGLKLWQEIYEPYNVIPFPAGNTGVQMGGWFKKPIKNLNDFKGLRIRMPGLTGRILERAGAISVNMTASEINTALRRGIIEAAEWIGPAHDEALGLYREADYYYYPGWHEPGTILELLVNKTAWDSLPADLQKIVEIASTALNHTVNNEFATKNIEALDRLIRKHHVKLVEFPPNVLIALKKIAVKLLDEEAQKSPLFDKIYRSYREFQAKNLQWYKITEHAYYNLLETEE
jgi:TRAP-type mannitol/chloroaromatic compound transport system substrate-binding protein